MEGLALITVGRIPFKLLDDLREHLDRTTVLSCSIDSTNLDPRVAYNAARGQHNTRLILPVVRAIASDRGSRILAICDVDLYSEIFTFVFGEAHLGGDAALISLHRLRPEMYGLAADPELLRARARKEALHEVGHLLGLVHCREPACVMHFSASAEDIDLKEDQLCERCAAHIGMPRSRNGGSGAFGSE